MTQEEYNRELADAQARGDWSGVAWLTNYMNPSTPGLGRLGFQTLGWSRTPGSFKGMPLLPETAPEGQLYLYPDKGLSNVSGPGAILVSQADAISKSAAPGNVAEAAKNLASAKQPTVPQFIQPYQQATRGFGAFGESDIF